MIIKIKSGKYMVPIDIEEDGNKIWVKFNYNKELVNTVKLFKGSKWHPESKIWSIENCARNSFQLAFLQWPSSDDPRNPYRHYDQPLLEVNPRRPENRQHQIHLFRSGVTYRRDIWAAEMGCITGDSIVHVNVAKRGFKCTLAELYYKFRNAATNRDPNIPYMIRSLCGDTLKLNKIHNVLFKFKKLVYKLVLKSGKTLRCTDDHEIGIGYDLYKPLSELKPGDKVLTNGTWVDKDGYIRVGGLKNKHPRWTTGGVYEHILIMEAAIGRHIKNHEIVHHKNKIRWDNRLENLELLDSASDHAFLHGKTNYRNLQNGDKVWFVPLFDEVVNIIPDGIDEVYDVVCEDPYRNFVANGVVVHNCGKTLPLIELLEYVDPQNAWYVGTRSAIYSVQLEFEKWQARRRPKFYTYEKFREILEHWPKDADPPDFVCFDESSRLKNASALRTQAAMHLADSMRDWYGNDCYIILMSGSPAPKSPIDYWSQCEITCPGFLREGTPDKLRNSLALIKQEEGAYGTFFPKIITWWDNENKCKTCGKFENEDCHKPENLAFGDYHPHQKSVNEVARLYKRMKGLVEVKFKKDCIDIPDKIYRVIECQPSVETLNLARLVLAKASTTAQAIILLRELSDGFQYQYEESEQVSRCPVCLGKKTATAYYDGEIEITGEQLELLILENKASQYEQILPCDHCFGTGEVGKFKRVTTEINCPKDDIVKMLLEEHEEYQRMVFYGGFTGSIDRLTRLCKEEKWEVIRADGRGWHTTMPNMSHLEMLKLFQSDFNERIAFVGHPAAAGMGLTLTASPSIAYYSNDFNAENRIQSEDRIHRLGCRGTNIIDITHLPIDKLILQNTKKKRDLQSISLGQLKIAYEDVTNINRSALV